MSEEIWKKIPNYESYEISNYGGIRKIGKTKIIYLKGTYCDGYIALKPTGSKKYFLVHRLVAELFIPKIELLNIVMHINNIRNDNRVDNLTWGTQKMNMQQALREGRKVCNFTKESRIKCSKLLMKRVEMLDKNQIKIREYESLSLASIENSVPLSHISACCNGKRKTAGGFVWKFV